VNTVWSNAFLGRCGSLIQGMLVYWVFPSRTNTSQFSCVVSTRI